MRRDLFLGAGLTAIVLMLSAAGPVGQPEIPNVNSLRALRGGQFSHVYRAGFAQLMDGGAADYYWAAAATCTDDGGSCIAPTSGSGRWLLSAPTQTNAQVFGVICDAAKATQTDLTARFDNLIKFINAVNGVSVYFGNGFCTIHSASVSRITSQNFHLYGQSSSAGNLGPPATPVGTIIRNLDTTASDLVISTGQWGTIDGFSFWPVTVKTDGCAIEIVNNGKASASGSYNKISRVFSFYGYRAWCSHAGTYNQWSYTAEFDSFDPANGAFWLTGGNGTSTVGGGGDYIDHCLGYSTDASGISNLPGPGAAFVHTAWPAAGTAVVKGHFWTNTNATLPDAAILVVTTAGTTTLGGLGPAFSFTGQPSENISFPDTITDGTAKFGFYQWAGAPYIHFDSNITSVQMDGCKVTQKGKFALLNNVLNASGAPPKQIEIRHEEGNSFWTHGIDVVNGGGNSFIDLDLQNVVTGFGYWARSTSGGGNIITGKINACGLDCVHIDDNHTTASDRGDVIGPAIIAGAADPNAAVYINNRNTVIAPGSYGFGAYGNSGTSKYGIKLDTAATGVHLASGAAVKGFTSAFNNLSTATDIEGIPTPWTPSFRTGGSAVGWTQTAAGEYLLRGADMRACFTINNSAKAGVTAGAATITLPRASENTGVTGTVSWGNQSNLAAGVVVPLMGQVAGNSSVIDLRTFGAGTTANATDASFPGNQNLLGCAHYLVPPRSWIRMASLVRSS
jgi:hypothetical protein